MPADANRWDVWEDTIRKPADQAAEGRRRIDCGPAQAEYQTAPLPDGRWVVRFPCHIEFVSGGIVSWRAFATREGAVACFRQEALACFRRTAWDSDGNFQACDWYARVIDRTDDSQGRTRPKRWGSWSLPRGHR